MMREFSDRTTTGLKAYKLFKLILPPFKSFLEINLEKEIDKHQDVIACAMAAARAGQAPDHIDTDRLLRRAREIDQAFLHKAHSLSAAINIDYPAIDRVRQRRIELVIATAYQVLARWQGKTQLRDVITGLYAREQYRSLLQEILNLYIEETRVLSKSLKIPHHLIRFRDSLINTVDTVMQKVAGQLVLELTDKVYKKITP